MRLRLGLIGLSSDWQQRHLPALRVLQERFEVAGIYSSVSSFAEKASQEFGAQQFNGFREMLSNPAIDAVLVLESSWYGTAAIEAACEFGKAVYCGSEIDILPSQAQALRQTVEQSGVAFMAEFPRRFAPASLRLKELIATRLGQPQLLFCHLRLPAEKTPSWHANQVQKPRIDRELVELIDWCRFIAGAPVVNVQGTCHHAETTANVDYASLSLQLRSTPNGKPIVAQISCGSYIPASWHEANNYRPPAALQVRCENGLAFVDLPSGLTWFDEAGRHQESLESELSVGQQLLTQFHRSVTSLVRKMADLDDVCLSLNTLQTARQSMDEGRVLSLPSQ